MFEQYQVHPLGKPINVKRNHISRHSQAAFEEIATYEVGVVEKDIYCWIGSHRYLSEKDIFDPALGIRRVEGYTPIQGNIELSSLDLSIQNGAVQISIQDDVFADRGKIVRIPKNKAVERRSKKDHYAALISIDTRHENTFTTLIEELPNNHGIVVEEERQDVIRPDGVLEKGNLAKRSIRVSQGADFFESWTQHFEGGKITREEYMIFDHGKTMALRRNYAPYVFDHDGSIPLDVVAKGDTTLAKQTGKDIEFPTPPQIQMDFDVIVGKIIAGERLYFQ